MRKQDGVLCVAALGGWALAAALWMIGREKGTVGAVPGRLAPLVAAVREQKDEGLRAELDAALRERDRLKALLGEASGLATIRDLGSIVSQLVSGEGPGEVAEGGPRKEGEPGAARDGKDAGILRASARLAKRLKELQDQEESGAEDEGDGMLSVAMEMLSDMKTLSKGEARLKGDLGAQANLEYLDSLLPQGERLEPHQRSGYVDAYLAVEFDLVHAGIPNRYLGSHLSHYEPGRFSELAGWQQKLLQSGRDRLDAALTPAQRDAVQRHREFMAKRRG